MSSKYKCQLWRGQLEKTTEGLELSDYITEAYEALTQVIMSLKYVTKKLEDQSLEEDENLSQKVSQSGSKSVWNFLADQASFGWVRHFGFFFYTKRKKKMFFLTFQSLKEVFLFRKQE